MPKTNQVDLTLEDFTEKFSNSFSFNTQNHFFVLFYFVGPICSMCKFPGEGSNPCHSNDRSCCSDNAGSLTHCATRELQMESFFFFFHLYFVTESLWDSWAHKTFCVLHFLFLGNKLQPPWPSLNSKGQVQTVANQAKEGMHRQGSCSQETTVQSWGWIPVPFQVIYITVYLGPSAELKPPKNGRC